MYAGRRSAKEDRFADPFSGGGPGPAAIHPPGTRAGRRGAARGAGVGAPEYDRGSYAGRTRGRESARGRLECVRHHQTLALTQEAAAADSRTIPDARRLRFQRCRPLRRQRSSGRLNGGARRRERSA